MLKDITNPQEAIMRRIKFYISMPLNYLAGFGISMVLILAAATFHN